MLPMTAPHVGAKGALAGTADRAMGTGQHGLYAEVSGANVLRHVVFLAHVAAG